MPDSQHAKNSSNTNVKASVRHTKSGKVVQVQSFDRNLDPMGEQLKQESRVPLVATPGKFPLGRSTPGTSGVTKAEQIRQDTELKMALAEVEQLKKQLSAVNAPPENTQGSPTQPTEANSYQSQFGYGKGTGEVGDGGGFGSPSAGAAAAQ